MGNGGIGPDNLLEIEEQEVQSGSSDSGSTGETQAQEEQGASVSHEDPTSSEEADKQKAEMEKEYAPEGKDKSYYELEKKLSEQGEELGQYRKFYEEAAPVIDFIQNDKELLDTVLDKLYGKSPQKEGTQETSQTPQVPTEDVAQNRQSQVKNQQASEDIMRAVDDRIKSWEDKQKYERSVDAFIESHPDFHEKLPEILKVIDKHGIDKDIELAYKIASYNQLQSQSKDDEKVVEERKKQAESVSGGTSNRKGEVKQEDPLWDVLGRPQDPNASFRGI